MKKIIVMLLFLAFCTTAVAQENGSASDVVNIEVALKNLLNDKGHTLIALYKEDGFMSREPFLSGKAVIIGGESKFIFEEVPSGTYAIVALHDENDNSKMDLPLQECRKSNGLLRIMT